MMRRTWLNTWPKTSSHSTGCTARVKSAFCESLARHPPHRIRGTGVFLAPDTDGVPLVLLHHLKHNQVLHENVVILTITTEESPIVPEEKRVEVESLTLGFHRVIGRYGFMEQPNAPQVLGLATALGLPIDCDRTTYYLARTTILPPDRKKRRSRMARWRIRLFALMKRNDRSATLYFGIPPNRVVELGTRVEL
jgi:KUP system potassium uptake protein